MFSAICRDLPKPHHPFRTSGAPTNAIPNRSRYVWGIVSLVALSVAFQPPSGKWLSSRARPPFKACAG
jgi:hypothetical protein